MSPDVLEHYTQGMHYRPRCVWWWDRYRDRRCSTQGMFMYYPYLLVSN